MAVTIHTVGVNTNDVGTWNGEDALRLLEDQLTYLNLHGAADQGLVVGISSVTIGSNQIPGNTDTYYDAKPYTTSGIGTGFSLYGQRRTGDLDGYQADGDLVKLRPNSPGYGFTGGEIVTFKADQFDNPTAPDITVQTVVAADINNAVSYAVTFTSQYFANGTDRNGPVLGVGTVITIREGDEIELVGNQSSTSFDIGIIRGDEFGASADGATKYRGGYVNYVGGGPTYRSVNGTNGTLRWRTRWGDRGTYYVRPDTTSYQDTPPTIIVEPADPADVTPTSFGGAGGFYTKSYNGFNNWAIWKQVIDQNKKYGTTFRAFTTDNSNSNIKCAAGPRWHPYYASNTGMRDAWFGGIGYAPNFRGVPSLDWSSYNFMSSYSSPWYNISQFDTSHVASIYTGGNTGYELNLISYKSSIDPNFVVYCYTAPTKSSSYYSTNSFGSFAFMNYTTNVWDLDYVFLSGMLKFTSYANNTNPYIQLNYIPFGATGTSNGYNYYAGRRAAEFGFCFSYQDNGYRKDTINRYYAKSNRSVSASNGDNPNIYYRPTSPTDQRNDGYSNTSGAGPGNHVDTATAFNAVIKGIPISISYAPCPYYLPDDFVMLEFSYNQDDANIQQGDTITISPSEVYTIIEAAYEQGYPTEGIAFCARTV